MTPFEEALTSGVTSGLAIVIIVGIVRYLDNRVKRHRQVQNIRDRLLYHFGRIRHAEAVETSASEPSPEITDDMVRYMLFQEMRRELGVLTTYRSTALTHSEQNNRNRLAARHHCLQIGDPGRNKTSRTLASQVLR